MAGLGMRTRLVRTGWRHLGSVGGGAWGGPDTHRAWHCGVGGGPGLRCGQSRGEQETQQAEKGQHPRGKGL